MDATEYADSQWLKADYLKNKGFNKIVLQITRVTEGTYQDGTKHLVLHFHENDKEFGLNKTNVKTLISLYGSKTEGWIDRHVTLFVTKTNSPQGGLVDCLRVDNEEPGKTTKRKHVTKDHGTFQSSTTAPAEEGLDDEIPFDPPAAKPDGMSFEQIAEAAASRGYEQLNGLYKAPTTTLEQKRWLSLNKLKLEQLYPRPSTD